MNVLTYIKLGSIAAALLGLLYFTWNYQHMQHKIVTLETQVAEQGKVITWYEKAAKTDQETQEVHNEIAKARDANDIPRMLELYRRLRLHQRLPQGKSMGKTGDSTD